LYVARQWLCVPCMRKPGMTRENGRTPRQVSGAMLRYHRERAGLSRADLGRQVSKSVSLIRPSSSASAPPPRSHRRPRAGPGRRRRPHPPPRGDRRRPRLPALPSLVPGLGSQRRRSQETQTLWSASHEEVDEQVGARIKRQETLNRQQPPSLWVIVDVSVLRRPVGGRHVMKEQLRLWAGGFALADFDEAPTVGYQETPSQGQFIDRREDVQILAECWDTLVREALPWATSQALLQETAKSWTSAT
jgi:hypothetical protein